MVISGQVGLPCIHQGGNQRAPLPHCSTSLPSEFENAIEHATVCFARRFQQQGLIEAIPVCRSASARSLFDRRNDAQAVGIETRNVPDLHLQKSRPWAWSNTFRLANHFVKGVAATLARVLPYGKQQPGIMRHIMVNAKGGAARAAGHNIASSRQGWSSVCFADYDSQRRAWIGWAQRRRFAATSVASLLYEDGLRKRRAPRYLVIVRRPGAWHELNELVRRAETIMSLCFHRASTSRPVRTSWPTSEIGKVSRRQARLAWSPTGCAEYTLSTKNWISICPAQSPYLVVCARPEYMFVRTRAAWRARAPGVSGGFRVETMGTIGECY